MTYRWEFRQRFVQRSHFDSDKGALHGFSCTFFACLVISKPKFQSGGSSNRLVKHARAKGCSKPWVGESCVPGVAGSRSFITIRLWWGYSHIEWRSKGGREGGACSLRGGTTGWVRGTSHPDIMSLVSPTWFIVMCSKSTGGVHCWRYARAHDLLWWPKLSMSSSPLS